MQLLIIIIISITFLIIRRIVANCVRLSGFQSDSSRQKTILVTGCDTGFGNKLVLKLISEGKFTFAGCYTESGETDLKIAAKNLNAEANLITFRLDVTNQESVDAAVDLVKKRLSPSQVFWGLVNNAGIPCHGPDDWMTLQDYQLALDVNCHGIIRMTHAFRPLLKISRGRIVITTSMYSRVAVIWGGPYCISKFAAKAYAEVLRNELAVHGLSVHIVEPGFYRTHVTNADGLVMQLKRCWQRLPKSTKEEYGKEFIDASSKAAATHIDWMCNWNSYRGIDEVVDSYHHALTARWPRSRYYPGLDMKVVSGIHWLPTGFLDLIQLAFTRYNKYPTPAACKKSN